MHYNINCVCTPNTMNELQKNNKDLPAPFALAMGKIKVKRIKTARCFYLRSQAASENCAHLNNNNKL